MKNAKDILIELWGDKETYDKYETLTAMIEYAVYKLEEQHKTNMQILSETFASKPTEVSSFNDVE